MALSFIKTGAAAFDNFMERFDGEELSYDERSWLFSWVEIGRTCWATTNKEKIGRLQRLRVYLIGKATHDPDLFSKRLLEYVSFHIDASLDVLDELERDQEYYA